MIIKHKYWKKKHRSQERWKPSLENNKKNSFEKKINEIKAENKINPIKNLKKESILLENQKRKNFSNKSNQLAENNLNKALKLQKQSKNNKKKKYLIFNLIFVLN